MEFVSTLYFSKLLYVLEKKISEWKKNIQFFCATADSKQYQLSTF